MKSIEVTLERVVLQKARVLIGAEDAEQARRAALKLGHEPFFRSFSIGAPYVLCTAELRGMKPDEEPG